MTFWFRIVFTWWLGHFTSRYLKVHFMLIKCTYDSKSRTLRMRYPFQSTGRPISHRNGWSFRVYMKCKLALGRERALGRKSPRCHVNTPLGQWHPCTLDVYVINWFATVNSKLNNSLDVHACISQFLQTPPACQCVTAFQKAWQNTWQFVTVEKNPWQCCTS